MAINHVVIVVSYNDIESTKEFINNSKKLNAIDKIIIVDNCSTNELYSEITTYISEMNLSSKVECIQSEKNGGYSYGNNFGIKYAIKKFNPSIISISNADVILNDEALNKCIDKLQSNNEIGFIAPTMKTPKKDTIKSYWVIPTYSMLLKRNFIVFLNLIRRFEKFSFEEKDGMIFVGCLNGSFFMGKTDTFRNIGFLDEDVFLYDEESILGCKIRNAGLCNAVVKDVSYIHNHKGSIEFNISSKKKRFEILHKSHVVYLTKYHQINYFQLAVFNLTYHIGLGMYLFGEQVKSFIKR